MGNHGQRDVPQRGRGRVGLEVLYLVVLWYVGWKVVDVCTNWVDVRNGLLSRGCSLVLSVLSGGLLISCSLRVLIGIATGLQLLFQFVHLV